MSSTTQVAVLAPLGRNAGPVRRSAQAGDRPLVRLTAFAALGLYGVLRWATLMKPAPTWRLLGLLALALVLAGAGPTLLDRERAVAARGSRSDSVSALGAPLAVLAVLAMFPIAGVPLAWTLHLRVAVTADGIGQGLSALPGILVPYSGINAWARVVMLLGAAILLLDAAMLLAFAPTALGDVRRAAAALPLIALVVVPATLVHPHLAYLHGLVLFALLAFFMWGERVPAERRGGVVLACAATGALGMIVAPALDEHSAWIDYQALTRGFTPGHVERFDWTQRYGPLIWPRTGNVVLDVQAAPKVWSGEYWKAENLDTFDGRGWSADSGTAAQPPPLDPAIVRRWTQNLTVTVRAMQTTQVIGAGTALVAPAHLPGQSLPGTSPGTYVSQARLGDGDTYTLKVYAPHPRPASLAREEPNYPLNALQGDMALTLPQTSRSLRAQTVLFAPFGSRAAVVNETNPERIDGVTVVQHSPYAQAYTLAQRLARTAPTPYAYVQNVKRYLGRDPYIYDEYPPPTQYPLATFLLRNHIGYCQQFAGSMALLLRMGGVPARVATGFTTGAYNAATKRWLVTDVDAHAWVEAWFPHYGWVTFDPTPAAAPARGGRAPIGSSTLLGGADSASKLGNRNAGATGGTAGGGGRTQSSSGASPILLGVLGGIFVALLAGGLVAWRRSGPLDAEGLLAELERALARSGRPISDGVTLAGLERRFRTSPQAAGYVRALRTARFAGDGALPTLRQRRALRAQLRAGLGLGGALRALWALPPRPERARLRRHHMA